MEFFIVKTQTLKDERQEMGSVQKLNIYYHSLLRFSAYISDQMF